MTRYNITPVAAYPAQATQIDISDVRVTLDYSADCQYFLVDENGALVSSPARCSLTAEQYALWSDNDEYFVSCILTNLNLSRLTE